MEEINELTGERRVDTIDIGGGLLVDFASDEHTPAFAEYAALLARKVPGLFDGRQGLVTEFGRALIAKHGTPLTRVECVKASDGRPIALTHAGVQVAIRNVYLPEVWPLRVAAYDEKGRPKPGPTVPQDIAGPACFSGDLLAENRGLPALEADDHVAALDVGAYAMAAHYAYNSPPRPALYGFDATPRGVRFILARAAQSMREIVAEAGGGLRERFQEGSTGTSGRLRRARPKTLRKLRRSGRKITPDWRCGHPSQPIGRSVGICQNSPQEHASCVISGPSRHPLWGPGRGEFHVSGIDACLVEAMELPGARGAAVVDWTSGLALGTAGEAAGGDSETAAAESAELARMAAEHGTFAPGPDPAHGGTGDDQDRSQGQSQGQGRSQGQAKGLPVEDVIITTRTDYHLLRYVETSFDSSVFLHLWLDRELGNLALARLRLADLAERLVLG